MKARAPSPFFSVLFSMLAATIPGGVFAADDPPGAARSLSLESFARLPVLDQGRKKPMDSLARGLLLQFSGRSTLDRRPAAEWLARLFFDPHSTLNDRIFLINHPQIPQALGLPVEKRRRYSAASLEPSFVKLRELAQAAAAIEEKRRSVVERELVRVYANVNTFLGLFQSFQFTAPLPDVQVEAGLRTALDLPPGDRPLCMFDLFQSIARIREVVEPLQEKPQEEWTALEQEAFRLSTVLFENAQMNGNIPLQIIPLVAHGGQVWLSPWDALPFARQSAEVGRQVEALAAMKNAYAEARQVEFDLAARGFRQSVEQVFPGDRELRVLDLEVLYNELDLFYRAEMFYGLAFFFAFAAVLSRFRLPRLVSLALLGGAFLPHTTGILLRMLIMGRPPMTNLYATFLFVAWVGVGLCLLMEFFQRNRLGALAASLVGLALLLLAGRFSAEGDPLGKVVAVLDSNFWLSTHVVCITSGYAGCVTAGLIGHFYILQLLFAPRRVESLRSTYRALVAVLGFGLTFSFYGTMLGGVWADQSWGRFWGWDPKENGALLIVLWCAVLFHARLGKMIDDLGMAIGCVLGIIVVLFAWLGVNLLGVGLHSYGFTSGLFRGLLIYIGAQLLFLFLTVPFIHARSIDTTRRDPERT